MAPTIIATMMLRAVEKRLGAGLSRGDWIHMAQEQHSETEALLVAAAPNHFLGVWAQWICGIIKLFLLKLQPKKE